ncbi:hypothetical protein FACS1894211_02970 [Clostridia bacterium]|nr:hypothetical protein FACS1894211_02970 [Clostridia bacterium]
MRIFLIVIDSFGIGEAPDAALYGDAGSNTYLNIVKKTGLRLPNLARLGLNEIDGIKDELLHRVQNDTKRDTAFCRSECGKSQPQPSTVICQPSTSHTAAIARLRELSVGKDTTTGHWEIAGILTERPFPTYPDGFPKRIVDKLETAYQKKILGNLAISGTAVIERYGAEHLRTGNPIVYTSADSVLQIAAHTDIVPLETLYEYCRKAREIMTGADAVGRIIARPFTTEGGKFIRTADRRDFSLQPPRDTLLNTLQKRGIETVAVGKIEDIFAGSGIDRAIHTHGNAEGLRVIGEMIKGSGQRSVVSGQLKDKDKAKQQYTMHNAQCAVEDSCHFERSEKAQPISDPCSLIPARSLFPAPCSLLPDTRKDQFIFINLVDTDMLYGHRNDPDGYARALSEIDGAIPAFLKSARPDDILILTADHGCDPTTPSADHSREYVPLLIWGKSVKPENLGTIDGFDFIAKFIQRAFFFE